MLEIDSLQAGAERDSQPSEGFWEQRIDEWIAATRNIPEDMARTGVVADPDQLASCSASCCESTRPAPSLSGRVLLSSQHVAKMMGELFALKNQAGASGHKDASQESCCK